MLAKIRASTVATPTPTPTPKPTLETIAEVALGSVVVLMTTVVVAGAFVTATFPVVLAFSEVAVVLISSSS